MPLFLLAVAVWSAVGCAVNPVTGRRELVFMSPAREAALGAQAAAEVEAGIGLLDDPALTAYVSELGERLARHSPRRNVTYRFYVADMPEPNAFALPGGYIYVSRGLLALANSEDELANVIGHEIGHVAARHAAQRETQAIGAGVLTALGSAAAGAAGGDAAARAVGQLGQAAAAGWIASYGRDQERQSDEVGQSLAAQAGWDPEGMADFMASIGREEVLRTGRERLPTWLDSHPVPAERVRTNRARAVTLERAPPAPIAATRREFLARIDGLRIGPDPREGVFQGTRFLHPGMEFAFELPEGWEQRNMRTAVGAVAPDGSALVVLELQGPATEPRAAADQFAQANGLRLEQMREQHIGGYATLRALARAQLAQGAIGLDLTWIAHPDAMLRLMGAAPLGQFDDHAARFRASARSFRSLRASERRAIRGRVLRVVEARSSETLAALSRRTGNVWSVQETAVVNALPKGVVLPRGEPIKIAVEVPLDRLPN
ncbi:MAG: M48 family metalloprotease [Myxococcota bacterium]|nr:M48 family metalloprotease [Myxococcota bacterium]